MKQHPIHSLLTPDPIASPLPPGFTVVRAALTQGLPAPLDVPGLGLTLLLSVPTARIRAWLDAEATTIAVESGPQREPVPEAGRDDDPRSALAPVLIATRGKIPIGLMPLLVNTRMLLPRAGEAAGAAIEIVVFSFLIPAEAMRGPGAGAGFVELAWRRVDNGTDAFMAPVARSALRERLTATTGSGATKSRRAVSADLFTEAGTDTSTLDAKGGLNWRLTHD